jgi:hypothetical protein
MFILALPILFLRTRSSPRLATAAHVLCVAMVVASVCAALTISEAGQITSSSTSFQDAVRNGTSNSDPSSNRPPPLVALLTSRPRPNDNCRWRRC